MFSLVLALTLASCEEILEPDLRAEKIVLLSPHDSTISGDTAQVFYWQHTRQYADYQLQVVSPGFDSMVKLVADTITSSNQVKLTLQTGKQYQWRVRGFNSSTSTPVSPIWNLWVK